MKMLWRTILFFFYHYRMMLISMHSRWLRLRSYKEINGNLLCQIPFLIFLPVCTCKGIFYRVGIETHFMQLVLPIVLHNADGVWPIEITAWPPYRSTYFCPLSSQTYEPWAFVNYNVVEWVNVE